MAIECNIAALASEGSELNTLMDKQSFQAVKTYYLALILKAVTGGFQPGSDNLFDYTNWCELATMLKPYDSLPDYAQRAAYIEMLAQTAEAAGVPDDTVSETAIRKALSCLCCSVDPKTMLNMEIFLLCNLMNQSQQL